MIKNKNVYIVVIVILILLIGVFGYFNVNKYNDIKSANKNAQVKETTTNSKKQLRIVSITGNPTSWSKNAKLVINASSPNGGLKYSFDNGKSYTNENSKYFYKNQTVKIAVKDKKNNIVYKTIVISKIDTNTPSVPTMSLSQAVCDTCNVSSLEEHNARYSAGTPTKRDVFVVVTAKDNEISYLHLKYECTITKNGKIISNQSDGSYCLKGTRFAVFKDGGKYTLQYRACDTAGNCSKYSPPVSINIDRTGPNISVSMLENSSKKITCKDDISNVKYIQILENGKAIATKSNPNKTKTFTASVKFSVSKGNELYFKCIDELGNGGVTFGSHKNLKYVRFN